MTQTKTDDQIRMLFLDIGGVLLTNGWDHTMRRQAADKFGIDYEELQERHHLTFDTYEEGKLTLDQYLERVVFHTERPFTPEAFKEHMFAQSKPFQETLDLMTALKEQYGLRVAAVSNEGRELTEHRIRTFRLHRLFDFFISSCFVHFRKPDADIYRMALDVAQEEPGRVLYIDDRALFVQVAAQLGIPGIVHKSHAHTKEQLAAYGLKLNADVSADPEPRPATTR